MSLSDHNGKNNFNLNNKSFTNRGASGGTPIYDIASSGGAGGGSVLNVTTSQGEIDVATASKYLKYFLSPAIYDLTSWDTAETDDTKRKNLEIVASGITHDSRSSSSPYWQPGGIFNVRIYMTKFLLRAGRFGHPSLPAAHFSVAFENFGINSHQGELAQTSSNEVNYLANWSATSENPNSPSIQSAYVPTGGTGTFVIAAVYHTHSPSSYAVSGDNFGVFQIDGKLHVGLYSFGPNASTDCSGDIAYAARVTELC